MYFQFIRNTFCVTLKIFCELYYCDKYSNISKNNFTRIYGKHSRLLKYNIMLYEYTRRTLNHSLINSKSVLYNIYVDAIPEFVDSAYITSNVAK